MRQKLVRVVQGVMEGTLLVLVCLSPWALGSIPPLFHFCLYVGLGALLFLWAVRMLAEWRFRWVHSPVAFCLVGLFLLGFFQTIPLSDSLLGWLSPATAEFYADFLPGQRETFADGTTIPQVAEAGRTLSLYPGATKRLLSSLLAMLLLFVVVRNNITSPQSLRRLSLAVVINGSLMGLFGVIQYYTTERGIIYWVLQSRGSVFGPYINKNFCAFYLNLCIGLGVGWFLFWWEKKPQRAGTQGAAMSLLPGGVRPLTAQGDLLNRPELLGVCLLLALMMGCVVFSQSRGGTLALLSGTVVGGLLLVKATGRWTKLFLPLLLLALLLPVIFWFGLEQVTNRYSGLWSGEAMDNSRWTIWFNSLRVGKDYPLLGTGYGTFGQVEQLGWQIGHQGASNPVYAHNEYVEAFVEGGAVRLFLSLLIIGLGYHSGLRAIDRTADLRTRGLAVGCLWAFTTVVIHSVFSFGINAPANALLATVILAHLGALGRTQPESVGTTSGSSTKNIERDQNSNQTEESKPGLALGGPVPLVASAVFLVLGWVICLNGWKWYMGERFYLDAVVRVQKQLTPDSHKVISSLKGAVAWVPQEANWHASLARNYHIAYRADSRRWKEPVDSRNGLRMTTSLAALSCSGQSRVFVVAAILARWEKASEEARTKDKQAREKYLIPGLKHCVLSRDLCPLFNGPHVMIAAYPEEFDPVVAPITYLERARKVRPVNPELWYLSGVEENKVGHRNKALACWKRSLLCSGEFCGRIVKQCQQMGCDSKEVMALLPPAPLLIVEAGLTLYPDDPEKQQPFWTEALVHLKDIKGPKAAELWHLKGRAHETLGQIPESLQAYKAALTRDRRQLEWRYHYVKLLFETERYPQAKTEVKILLRGARRDRRFVALYDDIKRAIRERGR
ncbi:MAG: O-antigen ligase family protein [Gemmataceae bacterium]